MKRNGFFTDDVRTFLTVGAIVITVLLLFLSAQTHSREIKRLESKYGAESYEVISYLKTL